MCVVVVSDEVGVVVFYGVLQYSVGGMAVADAPRQVLFGNGPGCLPQGQPYFAAAFAVRVVLVVLDLLYGAFDAVSGKKVGFK